jgi:hypothetical protein
MFTTIESASWRMTIGFADPPAGGFHLAVKKQILNK